MATRGIRIIRLLSFVMIAAAIAITSEVVMAAEYDPCTQAGLERECRTPFEEYGACLTNARDDYYDCMREASFQSDFGEFVDKSVCVAIWEVNYYACLRYLNPL